MRRMDCVWRLGRVRREGEGMGYLGSGWDGGIVKWYFVGRLVRGVFGVLDGG